MGRFLNQKITVLNASLVIVLLILIEVVVTTQVDLIGPNPPAPIKSGSTTESAKKVEKSLIPMQYGRSVNIPILTYHYIGNNPDPADKTRDNLSVAPDLFDSQMTHLANRGYTPITLDTLYAGLKGTTGLPGKPIVLSFDDGYIDFYVNAFPILRRFNFHAVSFIPTGLVGTSYYLHWEQVKEMDSSGLISFQAHSVNHASLPGLDNNQLIFQLVQSKKTLEAQLGKPVNFMAYPYGTSDERVWAAVKAAGYLGATGTWYGITESEGTIYDLPRVKISGGLPLEKFASMFP